MYPLLVILTLCAVQPIPITYLIYMNDPNPKIQRNFHIYGVVSTLGLMYLFGLRPFIACLWSFCLIEFFFRVMVFVMAYGA